MKVISDFGINLHRLSEFIHKTLEIGGTISKLTLNIHNWIKLFKHDPDVKFLVEGCAYGFTYSMTPPNGPYAVPNYIPQDKEHLVDLRIAEELEQGLIARVHRNVVVGTAALGIVDKQRSGFKKFRVVHDLSRPRDASVNTGINLPKRKFATFQSACDYMTPRAYMCKVDLSNAYRSVPMAPEWWPLHAFEWRGQVYSDLRMPFGNSGAPGTFDRFTQAIVRFMKAAGHTATVGYLDDFWLLSS